MLSTTSRIGASAAAASVALLVALAPAAGASPRSEATPAPVSDSGATSTYVVQVEPGSAADAAAAIADLGATPDAQFTQVVDGFSVDLTSTQASALAKVPEVSSVTADTTFSVASTQNPADWDLDRLDQRALPLDGSFTYPDSAGAGVPVYVVDTGVSANPAFGTRLASGFTAFADAYGTTDCHGHGTHVAGTIGSTLYGVAKSATIVPVRALDCTGHGTTTTVIQGLDWIAAQHAPGTPGVVNMSLAGQLDSALNNAVAGLVADGLTVVVAAGNDNRDACTESPASAPTVLTIGATDQSDVRASFSDWGPCVDLFAPGVGITSLDYANPGASRVEDGTSMASPHVAGIAALYLGVNASASPAQVEAVVKSVAAPVVGGAGATTTRLLASSNVFPTPGLVTGIRATGATTSSVSVAWDAPTGAPSQTYAVMYHGPGQGWSTLPATGATSATVGGLVSGTTYAVQVTASNANGTGAPSGPISITTVALPSATERYVTSVYQRLFSRLPDPGGMTTWTAALNTGTPRRAVADAITASDEYRSGLITASYRTYLGRTPDAAGLQNWLAAMANGMTVQAMEAGFVASDEFYQQAGSTPEGWVQKLYLNVLNRGAAPSEVSGWTDGIARGASRAAVATGFLFSTEHLATVINGHYEHLLDRGIDPSGLSTWVGQIQNGVRIESVIGGIIASDEYWSKNT